MRIYTGIFYIMPAWCGLCGTAAFKKQFVAERGSFDFMGFKKLYGQKRNIADGIDLFRVTAGKRNKLPVNAVVFILEAENIQRNGLKRRNVKIK